MWFSRKQTRMRIEVGKRSLFEERNGRRKNKKIHKRYENNKII